MHLKPSKKNLLYIVFLLHAFTGCKKGGNSAPVNKQVTTPVVLPNVDIYSAGYVNGPNNLGTIATYWKNGVPIKLTDSVNSVANAIAVKGNDVYVAGYVYTPGRTCCYWKNGVLKKLDSGGKDSYISAITISGNDVYMTGISTDINANPFLTYWKNDIPTTIPSTLSLEYPVVTGIAVSGTDVYLSGFSYNHYSYIATYWKNGIATLLEPSTSGTNSMGNAIAVNGTDIYVAGTYAGVATCWKNGIPTTLTGKGTSEGHALSVNGNDVYISGVSNGLATYWKNNKMVTFTNGIGFNASSLANSLAVNGNDVYVASGYDVASDYTTIWFNGQATPVIKGIAIINGMVVLPR